jgi:hypothetical protein
MSCGAATRENYIDAGSILNLIKNIPQGSTDISALLQQQRAVGMAADAPSSAPGSVPGYVPGSAPSSSTSAPASAPKKEKIRWYTWMTVGIMLFLFLLLVIIALVRLQKSGGFGARRG